MGGCTPATSLCLNQTSNLKKDKGPGGFRSVKAAQGAPKGHLSSLQRGPARGVKLLWGAEDGDGESVGDSDRKADLSSRKDGMVSGSAVPPTARLRGARERRGPALGSPPPAGQALPGAAGRAPASPGPRAARLGFQSAAPGPRGRAGRRPAAPRTAGAGWRPALTQPAAAAAAAPRAPAPHSPRPPGTWPPRGSGRRRPGRRRARSDDVTARRRALPRRPRRRGAPGDVSSTPSRP